MTSLSSATTNTSSIAPQPPHAANASDAIYNWNGRFCTLNPGRHENYAKTRTLGKVFLSLSIGTAAAATAVASFGVAAAAVALKTKTVVVLYAIAGATGGSVLLLATAIYYLTKPCWNDGAYRREQGRNAIAEIEQKMKAEENRAQKTITYAYIIKQYGHLQKYDILNDNDLNCLFKGFIASRAYTYPMLKEMLKAPGAANAPFAYGFLLNEENADKIRAKLYSRNQTIDNEDLNAFLANRDKLKEQNDLEALKLLKEDLWGLSAGTIGYSALKDGITRFFDDLSIEEKEILKTAFLVSSYATLCEFQNDAVLYGCHEFQTHMQNRFNQEMDNIKTLEEFHDHFGFQVFLDKRLQIGDVRWKRLVVDYIKREADLKLIASLMDRKMIDKDILSPLKHANKMEIENENHYEANHKKLVTWLDDERTEIHEKFRGLRKDLEEAINQAAKKSEESIDQLKTRLAPLNYAQEEYQQKLELNAETRTAIKLIGEQLEILRTQESLQIYSQRAVTKQEQTDLQEKVKVLEAECIEKQQIQNKLSETEKALGEVGVLSRKIEAIIEQKATANEEEQKTLEEQRLALVAELKIAAKIGAEDVDTTRLDHLRDVESRLKEVQKQLDSVTVQLKNEEEISSLEQRLEQHSETLRSSQQDEELNEMIKGIREQSTKVDEELRQAAEHHKKEALALEQQLPALDAEYRSEIESAEKEFSLRLQALQEHKSRVKQEVRDDLLRALPVYA